MPLKNSENEEHANNDVLNFQDIAKVEASIGKFSKQMEVCRMDKERWMGRFKASRALLAEIQNEISILVSLMFLVVCLFLNCKYQF